MKKNSIVLLIFLISIGINAWAQQPTFGLLKSDANAADGYTLFTPQFNNAVFLIDNCGEKINEWTFSETPGLSCYLLENGNLLRAGNDSLEIRAWDNTLLWSYAMTDNTLLQHHDIEPMPNGNILCVVTDRYSDTIAISAGRNPANLGATIRLERIVELEPIGTNDANIVWEWKFYDHLIQEFDSTKLNFGVVANDPGLLDFNFSNNQNVDFIHLNAVDYNEDLDQIMFSSRHLHEIYIIDHSTTILEAAGHAGGNSNKGGDFLWRWGNPQVYQQGSSADQLLFDQHDCKWIPSSFPDSGKVSVFNNNGDGTETFSSIHILTPDFVDNAYTMSLNKFLPSTYDWSWNGSILGNVVHENKKCGSQVLSNGNVLFCESSSGRISEITRSGDHLWSYRNPTHSGGAIFNQYEIVPGQTMTMFRGERYDPNHPGLAGQDLTPQGIIEDQNPLSESCILGTDESSLASSIWVINPIQDNMLRFNSIIKADNITIVNMVGQVVVEWSNFHGKTLPFQSKLGAYFIRISEGGNEMNQKIIVQ